MTPELPDGVQVVSVLPDIGADRVLDYLAPESMQSGTVVTIPLAGRSVRGWVTATGIQPSVHHSKLREVTQRIGRTIPEDIMHLTQWTANQYCGTWRSVMRAATQMLPNGAIERDWPVQAPLSSAGQSFRVEVVESPPLLPRLPLVTDRLANDGSTMVILPTHRAVGHLARTLQSTHGARIQLWDPEATAAVRRTVWDQVANGTAIVIGTRSVVWAPIPDLAAILIVDEHDEALQSEMHPTWHARSVAMERARRAGIPVSLISPVPTSTAMQGADEVVRAPKTDTHGWPPVTVIDPRTVPPRERPFASALVEQSRAALEYGAVLVIRNETGGTVLVACHHCGELQRCGACGKAVGLAQQVPFCPMGHPIPTGCVACGGEVFRSLRRGVAGVAAALTPLFPRARVVEVTATGPEVVEVTPHMVVVGTEAALHRAVGKIALIVILDFDRELLAPRLRAGQQAITLVARAAQQLDRTNGALVLETRLPDHPVVRSIRDGDPFSALATIRKEQQELQLPPYGYLAEIRGLAPAVELEADLRQQVTATGATLIGPNRQQHWLVRATNLESFQAAIGVIRSFESRARIYVDPPRV